MSKLITFSQLGRMGRLCNALFQVASTIGIARRNGFNFAFPLLINHDHRDRFGSSEDVDLYKHFVNPLPLYDGPELPDRFIDWGYSDVILTESVSLSGHMQSERFFSHALDEVRWYMKMKDEPPQNGYVAIHWRAGDYSSEGVYHPRMRMDYYRPAMALFPGAKFLVFSDDIEAAKKMFGRRVEYSEGQDYIGDFRMMKRCRHFIISNSSFSAFAAVLGDHPAKRVVAPFPWFTAPCHPSMIANRDIYGSDWTVIDYEKERLAA